MVALGTDDIHADTKRLKAAKVEFVEDPKDFGNVWVATVRDPEGNYVQLVQFKAPPTT
jgi:predicted enzyme related to lactoylglutathione lyase